MNNNEKKTGNILAIDPGNQESGIVLIGADYANCSKCGYQMDTHQERSYFRYCPNCGTDMRGKDK